MGVVRTALVLLAALALAGCGGDNGAEGPPEEAPFPPTDPEAVQNGAFEEGDEVTIQLNEHEGSSASGVATLIARGTGQTRVVVEVQGAGEGRAHIRRGNCDSLAEVAFPIGEVEDGRAERLVDLTLESMLAGEFAVAVSSAEGSDDPDEDPGPALACGVIDVSGQR